MPKFQVHWQGDMQGARPPLEINAANYLVSTETRFVSFNDKGCTIEYINLNNIKRIERVSDGS